MERAAAVFEAAHKRGVVELRDFHCFAPGRSSFSGARLQQFCRRLNRLTGGAGGAQLPYPIPLTVFYRGPKTGAGLSQYKKNRG